jgi:biopolymer transport protein ExbD
VGLGITSARSTGRGRIAQATLVEINVTPLVDVMLVLLVIFMTASAVESARLSREADTMRQVATEARDQRDLDEREQQVPVTLPKASAEKLVRGKGKERKPVLTFDRRRRIYLDKDLLVDCRKFAKKTSECLDEFEKALQKHPRAEAAREVHLRADRRLSYGQVLALMARMRRAGIRHFGLVSEGPIEGKKR